MILEFKEHEYIDVDRIIGLRWMPTNNAGVIILDGNKMVVQEQADFDTIERAFIYMHKSHMVDDKLNKVRFVRRDA